MYLTIKMKEMTAGVKAYIHFSEPDKGPLADFHTYAPDMMKMFADGIKENQYIVDDQMAKSFDFSDVITAPTMDGGLGVNAITGSETYDREVVSLLQQILEKDNSVILEGDTKEIFRVVEEENRSQTKAKGYNPLSMKKEVVR